MFLQEARMHRTFLLCAPLRFCWLHELDQVQWHGVMTESTRGKSARPSQRGGNPVPGPSRFRHAGTSWLEQ